MEAVTEGKRAPRVLVVEDERLVALDIKRTLEDLGYEVSGCAATSEDAIGEARRDPPDLVLLDVGLPGNVDGVETATILRRNHAGPIIFLTGSSDSQTLRRALATHPDGYLVKPFNPRILHSAVEVALTRHAAAEQLAQQRRELEARAQELATLNEIGDLLQVCDREEEIHAVVGRLGSRLFAGDRGAVYVADPSASVLELAASFGAEPGKPVFAPDECRAHRRGQSHRVTVEAAMLRCAHLDPTAPGASICVPLLANGEALGVLTLVFAEAGTRTRTREELATALAQRVALAVGSLRLRDRLRRESITDALTGLNNRRRMGSVLDCELRLAVRRRDTLSVILLDLDHFKRLNDTHGHAAADEVLRQLSAFLQRRLRVTDAVCRYGGEEIVIILPSTHTEGALQVAEELRAAIAGTAFHHGGVALPQVTASFGVAAFPEHGPDPATILAAADAAMYAAKAGGRNRVALAAASAVREIPAV